MEHLPLLLFDHVCDNSKHNGSDRSESYQNKEHNTRGHFENRGKSKTANIGRIKELKCESL